MMSRRKMVAWAPQSTAPLELVAVWVPPGIVDARTWWDALQDRVRDLAVWDNDPIYLAAACAALGLPTTKDPREADQFLVQGNLNLRTHLNLSLTADKPWPAIVPERDAPDALDAIDACDLETWVEAAAAVIGGGSLD